MLVWAVSLVAVVTWQVSAWEGLSPNALGNIVSLTRPGLMRVPAMLAGSLISYRYNALQCGVIILQSNFLSR